MKFALALVAFVSFSSFAHAAPAPAPVVPNAIDADDMFKSEQAAYKHRAEEKITNLQGMLDKAKDQDEKDIVMAELLSTQEELADLSTVE